tara:strand:- start:8515 stop:10341 length:1827 start_codon:yes stop_codon:yes gene_type:complete
MGLKKATVKLGADIGEFTSKMRKASTSFKKMGKNIQKAGKTMSMSLTATLTAFAAASVKAFDTQAQAEAKLSRSLNGNVKAFRRLKKEAQALQKVTLFGDEETMAAQAMLTSMGLEEEAVRRLTPLIQDMATTKNMDLRAAADLVSKSVGSSTNALTRYGVEITGAVGSSERLESAVKGLSRQFEGQAQSAALAGAGGLKQLSNNFGDLMEKIGEKLMPILNGLVKMLDSMITSWNNLDEGIKIAVITFGAVLASIGPLVYLFGTLVSVVGFFMSPLGAVIAGLAALAAGAIYVADNLEAFKEVGSVVFAKLQNAVISFLQFFIENNPFSFIIDGYNLLMEKLGREGVTNPFKAVSGYLEELKADVPEVTKEFGSFGDAVSNAATKAKDALFSLGGKMGIGGALSAAQSGESSTVSGSVKLFGMDVDEIEEEAEVIDTTYGDALRATKEKIDALKESAKGFGLAMVDNFAGSFATAITSGENFLVSMKNIFKDLAKQIAAMIIKAAVLAAIFSMIPGLGAAQTAGGGATSFSGLLTGMMGGSFANGGQPPLGKVSLVGEAGPELFVPSSSGTIVPNNALGGTVIPDVRISGDDLLIVFDRANRRKARR